MMNSRRPFKDVLAARQAARQQALSSIKVRAFLHEVLLVTGRNCMGRPPRRRALQAYPETLGEERARGGCNGLHLASTPTRQRRAV